MADKLTPRVELVLGYAREEAERLRHSYIGTEHLLLGIIKLGQGVAVNVLQKQKVNLPPIRVEIEEWVGLGPEVKTIGNPSFTPRAKRVLVLARKQAKSLNHSHIGTELLLLGLLLEGKGPAALILKKHGVEFELTRCEVLKELHTPQQAPAHPGCLFAWCWWV
jgi:ATP-dependent Clp protease ATP-binding subunit ClpC